MHNVILIKRSTTAADPSTTLNAGELAYSYSSNKLYIGNANGIGNGAVAIGGSGVLSSYALLSSPVFTGDPQAPTPLLTDNDTSIATTAFVKGQEYLTQNDVITVTGDASGTGRNAISLILAATGVGAGTYTKVTVDTKGRVTSGTTLLAADIPTLSAAKISDFDTQVRTTRLDQLAAPTSTVSFNSQVISNVAAPVNPGDAANKAYVDAARSGLDVKDSVRVSVSTNVNIAAPGTTLDGVTMVAADRVLLRGQTTGSENGIWVYNGSAAAMTRATDADSNVEVTSGLFTFVEEGTSADAGFVLVTNNPITLGTTSLSFTQFSGAGMIVAGAGIIKTGDTLDIVSANTSRIVVNADSVDLATVGTAGTYRAVSTDAYGRVISGNNPTTLAGYGITDAQPLSAELTAESNLITTGLQVRTGAGTRTTRSIAGTTNRVNVVNGDGINGNPAIDIATTYTGQTSITTLGTISSGVWQGSTIGVGYGGTGSTGFGTNQIPFYNGTILTGVNNFTWNNSTTTLSVNGIIENATISGGTF